MNMEPSPRRVVINVGGVRFETYASTLQSFPGTKLATLVASWDSGDDDLQANELFFDRNPKVFGYILDYYRTRHLHCSGDMCRSVLLEELRFWELDDSYLADCCWLKTNQKATDLEDFVSWDETTQNEQQELLCQTARVNHSWRGRWQPRVWSLFEKPFSSLTSMCFTAVSLLFSIGAIVIFFEETKQEFFFVLNVTKDSGPSEEHDLEPQKFSYLLHLELVCVVWFMFEFCARAFFCPDWRDFVKSPLNWADFVSLFPVVIELISAGSVAWRVAGFMRAVYVMKLVRLLVLLESGLVLRVLSGTLRAIAREILILLLVLALETLFFAALVFYTETKETDTHFTDMYSCCWWAIITLTTVGYGDAFPVTTGGRIVCSLAAISGILTIVIPIPILMIKFQHYYSIALAKEKLKGLRTNEPSA